MARAPASSSAVSTTGPGKGHASNRSSHQAPTTPAAHGHQKAFKGKGRAYGRSKPKGAKPAPVAQNQPKAPAIPPGQAKPRTNNGKGHKQ